MRLSSPLCSQVHKMLVSYSEFEKEFTGSFVRSNDTGRSRKVGSRQIQLLLHTSRATPHKCRRQRRYSTTIRSGMNVSYALTQYGANSVLAVRPKRPSEPGGMA